MDALAAEGQQGQDDALAAEAQAILTADLKWGPFLLQPGLTGSGGWRTVDEARRLEDRTDAPMDFVATVSPGLVALLPGGGRRELRIEGGLIYEWFYEFAPLRTMNYRLLADYRFTGSRLAFSVRNHLRNRQRGRFDPLEPGDVIPGPGLEIDRRLRYLTNDLGAVATYRTSIRTVVGLGGSVQRLSYGENEELVGNQVNNTKFAVTPSFAYELKPTTTLTADYSIEVVKPDTVDNIRELTQHTVRVGARWEATGPLSGAVSGGYSTPISVAEGGEGYTGFVVEGLLAARFSEILGANFTISRAPFLSAGINNTYFLRTGFSGELGITATSAVIIRVGGSYFVHDYPGRPGEAPDPGITGERTENLTYYGVSVQWLATERGTVKGSFGYRDRVRFETVGVYGGYVIGLGYSFVY